MQTGCRGIVGFEKNSFFLQPLSSTEWNHHRNRKYFTGMQDFVRKQKALASARSVDFSNHQLAVTGIENLESVRTAFSPFTVPKS
jgi:hypothetical protein